MQEILRELVLNGLMLYAKACRVDAVHGNTCDVTPVDGSAPVKDVRLSADVNGENRWMPVPKVGSVVIVDWLTDAVAFVSMVSEVEAVIYEKGDTAFRIDEKMLLANGEENLLKLMQDFVDVLLNTKHMTNSGPTISLTPESTLHLETIKDRFETLLKAD